MINKRLILAISASLCFSAAFAGSVYERVLDNGLKLLVKEDHRSPIVYSSVWYKVGGSYEHNGITGISHVVEHMMFQGTQQYGPTVFNQMIEQVGGMQNAGTSQDLTFYYQTLPAKELALSFKLESDRMRHLLLTEEAFQKEVQVVMEERRMRLDNNPQRIVDERLSAAAFVNNPYHHDTVGWMTDLENMTAADVRNWYDTWYHPNNATVIVVGDVNPETVYGLAKQYFGAIPARAVPIPKPRTEVPPLGEVFVNVSVPAKLPYLQMAYLTTSLTNQSDGNDAYALDVLSMIIGGSESSRLQQDLVRKQQVATQVSAYYNPFSLHSGLWELSAVPASGESLEQLEQAMRQQVKRLKTSLITEQELSRVKAQLIASKLYGRDSLSQQAWELGVSETVGLPWQTADNYINAINAVSREQIKAVAVKYFQDKRLTIAVLHPTDEEKSS